MKYSVRLLDDFVMQAVKQRLRYYPCVGVSNDGIECRNEAFQTRGRCLMVYTHNLRQA
jgi:hypothetical protein